MRSRHSVDETVEKIQEALKRGCIKVFAVIDHSGGAEEVGMTMPPTKVVIFGNPKSGTPLMIASPSIAIDLPLKLLVAEDGDGLVWVSYNSLEYLEHRHGVPGDLIRGLQLVEGLAASVSA